MKFKFKAKKISTGEISEDYRESKDKFSLAHELKADGLSLLSAQDESTTAEKKIDFEYINEFIIRIKLHEKIIFANNLSSMLTAGLSLSRALSVLERQTKNAKFKKIIKAIIEEVNSGKTLSSAMAKYPKVFPLVFTAMVAAGEESGQLPESLKIVGNQLEKSYSLRKKIRGAMMYPAIVVIAMVIISALMLIFVVPNLISTFKEFKIELPLSTRIVIALSNLLIQYTVPTLLVIIVLIFSFWRFMKTTQGKRAFDFTLLHMPIIGDIAKQVNAATTARTLSSLISSGVNMLEALSITGKVIQNSYYKEVIEQAKSGVEKGQPLSGFFQREEGLYPVLIGEMAEVGEETGKLSEMLLNIAIFYENEVDAITKDMSTIIEPFLMLLIGGGVGFFAISMIQPMYAITNSI